MAGTLGTNFGDGYRCLINKGKGDRRSETPVTSANPVVDCENYFALCTMMLPPPIAVVGSVSSPAPSWLS
jgi:hypothetical protein